MADGWQADFRRVKDEEVKRERLGSKRQGDTETWRRGATKNGHRDKETRRQGVTATDNGGKEKKAVFLARVRDLPEELPRFDNSQNVKMTSPSITFPRFRNSGKRENKRSTLFRTVLLVPSPETRSCASWVLAGP